MTARGVLLPGWECASCRAFNGSAKELLENCRACGEPYPFGRSGASFEDWDAAEIEKELAPWPETPASKNPLHVANRARLAARVVSAVMAYLAPGSKETFAATKTACAALRHFESCTCSEGYPKASHGWCSHEETCPLGANPNAPLAKPIS